MSLTVRRRTVPVTVRAPPSKGGQQPTQDIFPLNAMFSSITSTFTDLPVLISVSVALGIMFSRINSSTDFISYLVIWVSQHFPTMCSYVTRFGYLLYDAPWYLSIYLGTPMAYKFIVAIGLVVTGIMHNSIHAYVPPLLLVASRFFFRSGGKPWARFWGVLLTIAAFTTDFSTTIYQQHEGVAFENSCDAHYVSTKYDEYWPSTSTTTTVDPSDPLIAPPEFVNGNGVTVSSSFYRCDDVPYVISCSSDATCPGDDQCHDGFCYRSCTSTACQTVDLFGNNFGHCTEGNGLPTGRWCRGQLRDASGATSNSPDVVTTMPCSLRRSIAVPNHDKTCKLEVNTAPPSLNRRPVSNTTLTYQQFYSMIPRLRASSLEHAPRSIKTLSPLSKEVFTALSDPNKRLAIINGKLPDSLTVTC